MRLERLSEYITIVVVSFIGMGLALYCGQQSGGGNAITPMAIIGGVIAMMFALWQRARLWFLIPMCWGLVGKTAGLPVRDGAIVYVFVVYLIFRALKIVRAKHNYVWVDVLLWINIIYVGVTYIRNPVGVEALNSEMVAGRPYLEIIFAIMAYSVIGYVTISAEFAKKIPWLSCVSELGVAFLSFLTSTFPFTAPFLSKIYSDLDVSVYNLGDRLDVETQRAQYLFPISGSIFRLLSAYFPPITLFNPFNIIRFSLLLVGLVFALQSGHRIAIICFLYTIVVGSYFRTGLMGIFKLTFILIPVLVCVIILNGALFNMPIPVQRALSFLPGNWDERAKDDAKGSSEWRFDMWRKAWESDKYIKNRWFGDGFGITRRQLDEGKMVQDKGLEEDADRENLALVGDFHSGPLSSIRFVGVVGFALYMILTLGMAVYATRLILRSKNTPFFVAALFFGAPVIWDPVGFVLIFGDYKEAIPQILFKLAMLKLIERSLVAWRAKPAPQNERAGSGFLASTSRTGVGLAGEPDFFSKSAQREYR